MIAPALSSGGEKRRVGMFLAAGNALLPTFCGLAALLYSRFPYGRAEHEARLAAARIV